MVKIQICQELPGKSPNNNKNRKKYDLEKIQNQEIRQKSVSATEEKIYEEQKIEEIERKWPYTGKNIQEVASE